MLLKYVFLGMSSALFDPFYKKNDGKTSHFNEQRKFLPVVAYKTNFQKLEDTHLTQC